MKLWTISIKYCTSSNMKDFLTDSRRQELRGQHRKERDGRVRDRIKAILLADKGWSYVRIAEALMLDEETISRHIQEYLDHDKLKPENGGSSSKLNEKQTLELVAHLETETYMKVSDIRNYIQLTYDISYTAPGVTSWLKVNGFSYKKPAATPAKADSVKQEEFIAEYKKLIQSTPKNEPILFGDGVHPTMATKVTYGWIRTGTRKPIATTASRTRMNVMGSLDLNQMALYTTSHDTIDSKAMEEHFQHLRCMYPNAPKIHLILDQGSYNTSKVTQNAAAIHNIILHYLPPYSPNLNPIERCWKIMNEYVRNNRFFSSAKEFREKITNFFNKTWPSIAMDLTSRVNDNFQRLKSIT